MQTYRPNVQTKHPNLTPWLVAYKQHATTSSHVLSFLHCSALKYPSAMRCLLPPWSAAAAAAVRRQDQPAGWRHLSHSHEQYLHCCHPLQSRSESVRLVSRSSSVRRPCWKLHLAHHEGHPEVTVIELLLEEHIRQAEGQQPSSSSLIWSRRSSFVLGENVSTLSISSSFHFTNLISSSLSWSKAPPIYTTTSLPPLVKMQPSCLEAPTATSHPLPSSRCWWSTVRPVKIAGCAAGRPLFLSFAVCGEHAGPHGRRLAELTVHAAGENTCMHLSFNIYLYLTNQCKPSCTYVPTVATTATCLLATTCTFIHLLIVSNPVLPMAVPCWSLLPPGWSHLLYLFAAFASYLVQSTCMEARATRGSHRKEVTCT
jgi:hypothetical protein